jgi:tetratricopeptide (TPR) repeat protein
MGVIVFAITLFSLNSMMLMYRNLVVLLSFIMIVSACSTEKNTLINRTFHGTTAHYNGYFNATELIRMSVNTFRTSLKEDYYSILPIEPLPNEDQVIGLYPSIDTAIVKCTKVIQRHSMPSNDKPSLKKEEHNNWIDENWTMIGVANFYRRDYEGAMKSFMFVKKFYSNDPSIYIGELWMAKTNMELNKLTEAGFNIASLDKAIDNQKEGAAKEDKKAKSSKKEKKEAKVAKVPKSIRFDFEKTKAEYSLRKKNPQDAIKYLEASLEFAKKRTDKSRIHFIIAQLYESVGNREAAKKEYTLSLKYTAPYELHFNARLKRAFMGGDEKVRKELLKMLRDAKNAPFKDQIYYALSDIELQNANKPKAIEYLTLSAFYSTSNPRQKGMSYEKMGDLSFAERNYVKAQKYYDSCATVIDDKYPNAEGIRNKATKLADLVAAVETANFEDSVQRIAQLSEEDRVKFIENVIKKTKEDNERRKIQEAERLRELQQNQNNFVQSNGNGNKWYFNNAKSRSDGFDEFRKLWGTRVNEDNWRRTDKEVVLAIKEPEEGDTAVVAEVEEVIEKKSDTLTVEQLLGDIPLTDSAMIESTKRLLEALYNAGVIYKEQLNEPELAKKQFTAVIDRKTEGIFDLSSSFQLYKMNEVANVNQAAVHKDYILIAYPNSDYANYLRDPDFFIKRKEREALAEQEYVTVLDRYNRGLYYPVLSKAEDVIVNEIENQYRPKYMLLKAMSIGQTTNNKEEMLPVLNQLVAEYPGTAEEIRANEMLLIIKNGYSKNIEVDFSKKSPFTFDDKAEQWVIVFLDKKESSTVAKTKVSDFNREYFSRDKLKVSSKIYGDDESIILVQEFENDMKAAEYLRVFKATRKHLMDLQKAKILVITQENMKLLFLSKNLVEYEAFYDENY